MERRWSFTWMTSTCPRRTLTALNLLWNCWDNGWTTEDGLTECRTRFSRKFRMYNSSHQWVHQEEVVMKSQEESRPNSSWSISHSPQNLKWEESSIIFSHTSSLLKILMMTSSKSLRLWLWLQSVCITQSLITSYLPLPSHTMCSTWEISVRSFRVFTFSTSSTVTPNWLFSDFGYMKQWESSMTDWFQSKIGLSLRNW